MGADKKMTKSQFLERSDQIVKEVGEFAKDELFRLVWRSIQTGDKTNPSKQIDEDEMRRFGESYAEMAIKKLIKSEGFMENFK